MSVSKAVSTILGPSTVTANSVTAIGTTLSLATAIQCLLTAECTYPGTAPDQPAMLEVYTSFNGVNFDSDPFKSIPIPVRAGSTARISIDVPASALNIAVKIRNADTSSSVTNAKVTATIQTVS